MTTFFVGGSQRSGTTLLQTLLCQHTSVNPLIREAKYLRHLVNAYSLGKRSFDNETCFYFQDEEAFDNFNQDLIQQFIHQVANLFPSSEHLVLREPHLTLMFPLLFKLLPAAKFLCIVRNPLDVIASMIEVGRKLENKGIDDDMSSLFNGRDMKVLSQYFLSFYMPLLSSADEQFKNNLRYIRYEDLVSNPKQVLLNLEQFTHVKLSEINQNNPLDSGLIDYELIGHYSEAWRSPLYDQVISSKRINTYANTLSNHEIDQIQSECHAFMQAFSYL